MIDYSEALERIGRTIKTIDTIQVPIAEAFGNVLARDIFLREDLPPFDNSAMDGFAVRSAELVEAAPENPVRLRSVGIQSAGKGDPPPVPPGCCLQIMTGALVPKQLDSVVPVERVTEQDGEVLFFSPSEPGANIRIRGTEMREGEKILSAGTRIDEVNWGLLAASNTPEVSVYRKPKVALLVTGDELIEPGVPSRPGAVRNSNGYTMQGALRTLGVTCEYLGVVPDRTEELEKRLELAQDCDVLVTIGGVSAGKRDIVRDFLDEQSGGFNEIFYKVRIRPGKPVKFGVLTERRPVFALPGNPVSCLVVYHVLVKPALRKLWGMEKWSNPVMKVRLAGTIHSPAPFLNFWRAKLNAAGGDGVLEAVPFGKSGSGMLTTLQGADGFVPVPVDRDKLEEGEIVSFIPLNG